MKPINADSKTPNGNCGTWALADAVSNARSIHIDMEGRVAHAKQANQRLQSVVNDIVRAQRTLSEYAINLKLRGLGAICFLLKKRNNTSKIVDPRFASDRRQLNRRKNNGKQT
jgi:hypothetical protein